MPCSEKRARKMVECRKATPFWKRGIFCIRLNVGPSARNLQPIAVGVDPGSKREGLTVKSEAHTLINIQAIAVTHVSDAVGVRRAMRRARRFRHAPYRKDRQNRARGGLPPSTKARWQWKLRLCRWLSRLYPISAFVIEDIKAGTKGQRRWDTSFSPVQTGKEWFYGALRATAPVHLKRGWETKELRDRHGLKKTTNKLAERFAAHCVDSWVLANWLVGGHVKPENEHLLLIAPLRFHRRQIHRLQPGTGGQRLRYGGTLSHGLKRGSLVRHPKFGLVYVGGFQGDRISLHALLTSKRLTHNAKVIDCKFVAFNSWRTWHGCH
jgi:RRXRR protein